MNASMQSPAATTPPLPDKALLCLPAYNEAENIVTILDSIARLPNKARFDVLVVDDGSADDTRAVCEARHVAVVSHIFNLGYGAALKTGYKYATENGYAYIIQMDADGQHDADNVASILDSLLGADAPDIVIGSRFVLGSVGFHTPPHKKIVIQLFRLLIAFGTGNRITDPTSGLQGLSRRAFAFYAKYDRFALDFPDANMIIQMALNQFSIREVPAIMHPRVKGVSMHTGLYKQLKYIVKMFISVLIIYMREASAAKKVGR